MTNQDKNSSGPKGDTDREPMEDTAKRSTGAASSEAGKTGGVGAARGADAKSQPHK